MSEQFDSSEGEGNPKLYTGETAQDAKFSELLDILKKQLTLTVKVKTTTKPAARRGRQYTEKQIRAFEEYEASADLEKAVGIFFPDYYKLRNHVVKKGYEDRFMRSYRRWFNKKKKKS
jgi:hypothetical protein